MANITDRELLETLEQEEQDQDLIEKKFVKRIVKRILNSGCSKEEEKCFGRD